MFHVNYSEFRFVLNSERLGNFNLHNLAASFGLTMVFVPNASFGSPWRIFSQFLPWLHQQFCENILRSRIYRPRACCERERNGLFAFFCLNASLARGLNLLWHSSSSLRQTNVCDRGRNRLRRRELWVVALSLRDKLWSVPALAGRGICRACMQAWIEGVGLSRRQCGRYVWVRLPFLFRWFFIEGSSR